MAHSDKYQDVLIKPGMDESIDSRLLPMGTPRLLQNVRTRRAARFDKRPGALSLGISGYTLPTQATTRWAGQLAGRPVFCADDQALGSKIAPNVYRQNAAGNWDRLGRHAVSVPERRFGVAIAASGSSTFAADRGQEHTCAVAGGLLYVAYCDVTAGTTVTIYQIDPDGLVLRKQTLSDAAEPRLVYANSVLYIVTREPSSGTDIEVRTVAGDLTLGSAVTLGSTLHSSSSRFDTAAVEGGTTWTIAYREDATHIRVRIMSGTTSSVDATIETTAAAASIGVAAYEGEYVCVAYLDGTTIEASVLATSDLTGNNFTVRAAAGSETYEWQCGVVRSSSGQFYVVCSGTDQDTGPVMSHTFCFSAEVSTSAVILGPYKHFHWVQTSKPWAYGNSGERRVLIWAQNGAGYALGQDQPKNVILDVTSVNAYVHGITYEHSGGFENSSQNIPIHVPEAPSLGSGRRATVIPWDDPGPLSGIDVVVWHDAKPDEALSRAVRHVSESGGALNISGAALQECPEAVTVDASIQLPENGFPHYPATAGTVGTPTGGALTAGQEYSYVALYRWQDSVGRVHRGAPSEVKTLTPTGVWLTGHLRIASLSGSSKVGAMSGNPVADVYRSWNGGPYYYVGSTGAIDSVGLSAGSITYDDDDSDTTVESNHVLYTDLGVLPTEPPSGAALMCQGGQRLAVRTWRANVGQYSKLYVAGTPWEFVDDDAFRVFLPDDITAIGFMDGAWIWFTAARIYVVTGGGPDDQGSGQFSEPQQLPAVVGADSPHIVEVNEGLMFKGGGTIYLLPRGFGPPVPVGDPIQETLADFPYLRAAFKATNGDDDCTHFVLAASDVQGSTETKVAVYDNRFGSWSLDDINGEVGAAAAVDGRFSWALPTWSSLNAHPFRQFSVSAYQDLSSGGSDAWIERRIEFGDWRPAGVLGQGRLSRIGMFGERGATGYSPLHAVVTVDGAEESVRTFDLAGTPGTAWFREIVPTKQAGTAFQLSLYDSQASGFVPSGAINALGIETDIEPGLRRPGEGERQ